MRKRLQPFFEAIPFWLITLTILVIIYDFGFPHGDRIDEVLQVSYRVVILISAVALLSRYVLFSFQPRRSIWLTDGLLFLLFVSTIIWSVHDAGAEQSEGWFDFLDDRLWIRIVILLAFFRELSHQRFYLSRFQFNPAQLFIGSFIVIILFGAILLLLPNATHDGISLIDALFTSTSAVCVTGLIVVDTGSYFTIFGQLVILGLFQIGGIGIMTFTSFFSYFFKGGTTFESQLMLNQVVSSDRVSQVFSTLGRIIVTTFTVELIGAALILVSLREGLFEGFSEEVFFSVFHAVSGFCNAGFSTLSNSLYDVDFRFLYSVQMIVAVLFIFGGLGFPIVFNIAGTIKHFVKLRWLNKNWRKTIFYRPENFNVNSKIVIITTAGLLTFGTVMFYILEYNNTLQEHNWYGKIVTAFFGAATPRTAGFNTVDTSALHISTVLVVIMLMWIGASPGSTGGGIKTSTFAVAFMNCIKIARGRNKIEVFKRELSNISISRATAIIFMSLIFIWISVFIVSLFDGHLGMVNIVFECFSAFSTVGLSLGVTADFSSASKLVLVFTMLIGRVGTLSLIIALIKKAKYQRYNYPTEDVLIN